MWEIHLVCQSRDFPHSSVATCIIIFISCFTITWIIVTHPIIAFIHLIYHLYTVKFSIQLSPGSSLEVVGWGLGISTDAVMRARLFSSPQKNNFFDQLVSL